MDKIEFLKLSYKQQLSFVSGNNKQCSFEERINLGLRLFSVSELREMTANMFLGREKMSYRDIINYFENDGLNGTDATDLLDVLVIQKIVEAVEYPNYKLKN